MPLVIKHHPTATDGIGPNAQPLALLALGITLFREPAGVCGWQRGSKGPKSIVPLHHQKPIAVTVTVTAAATATRRVEGRLIRGAVEGVPGVRVRWLRDARRQLCGNAPAAEAAGGGVAVCRGATLLPPGAVTIGTTLLCASLQTRPCTQSHLPIRECVSRMLSTFTVPHTLGLPVPQCSDPWAQRRATPPILIGTERCGSGRE